MIFNIKKYIISLAIGVIIFGGFYIKIVKTLHERDEAIKKVVKLSSTVEIQNERIKLLVKRSKELEKQMDIAKEKANKERQSYHKSADRILKEKIDPNNCEAAINWAIKKQREL